MKLIIKKDQTEVDLHISTVTLTPTDDHNITLFRCMVCGSPINQYEGDVIKIYPIAEPQIGTMVISRCVDCGTLYTFHTQNYSKPQPTKVILFVDPNRAINTFRCFICRMPLINFTLNGIYDITNNAPATLPYLLKCQGRECPANYKFIDIV